MKTMIKIFIALAVVLAGQNVSAQEIASWKIADLQKEIAGTEKPTIFNFWATWCKPCIEELPHFQELAKKYESEGVQLVLVSLDMMDSYPHRIRAFAKKRKITSRLAFLDETDADVFCPAVDESWSGSIPASLFINNKTGHRKFIESQLSAEELETAILEMIGKKNL